MSKPTYIFCHGLNGFGESDWAYGIWPYWGGPSGDIVAAWREKGIDAKAASVSRQGSAWDRACELYAQLAGARVDYGRAHAECMGHARYGRDYSSRPLIPFFDDKTRLVLIGHSLGGVTVRMLAHLLANGSERERAETPEDDLCPLFAGGMCERVLAVVTIAAPTNGSSVYEYKRDPSYDGRSARVPLRHRLFDEILKIGIAVRKDARDERDWADFDMLVDNALALNEWIETLPNAYYLSCAFTATTDAGGGDHVPDAAMQPLFKCSATHVGRYRGVTEKGVVIDDRWHENDGLVNTFSARAPLGARAKMLDRRNIERGVWNIMDDIHAHHAFVLGGPLAGGDPGPLFQELLELLESLS